MTDITVTAANVGALFLDAKIRSVKLAEAFTAGLAMYVNSNGLAAKADAGAAASAKFRGIITQQGGIGQGVSVQKNGEIGGFDLSGLAYDAPVYLSDTAGALSDTDPGLNEQQTVTIGGTPTGGTFALTFDGQTTSALAYNASAATVEAALEALSTIGVGNVRVTGAAGGPYTVEFMGVLGKQNNAALTVDITLLTGGTPTGTIATAQGGIASIIVGRVVPMSDKDKTKVLDLIEYPEV